jgi:hypothetical protein
MKIALVWYWERASEIFLDWRDGLKAAVEELQKENEVHWFFDKTIPLPEDGYDAVVLWGDSNCEFIQRLPEYTAKKGLCLTTDPHNIDSLRAFDVVFCETTPVLEQVRRHGIRAIKAFGTDTEFYTPDETIEKSLDYFYPATFSPWKKQSEIAHLGPKLTCIGTIQPDGMGEYQACRDAAVNLEVGYFPAEKIRDYYRKARNVIIPAVHGSERTVLEAMACGVFPTVLSPLNVRTQSIVEEFAQFRGSSTKTVREFVEKNYSAKKYAQDILRGLS